MTSDTISRNIIQATVKKRRIEIIKQGEKIENPLNFSISLNDSMTGAAILIKDMNTWEFKATWINNSNIVSSGFTKCYKSFTKSCF